MLPMSLRVLTVSSLCPPRRYTCPPSVVCPLSPCVACPLCTPLSTCVHVSPILCPPLVPHVPVPHVPHPVSSVPRPPRLPHVPHPLCPTVPPVPPVPSPSQLHFSFPEATAASAFGLWVTPPTPTGETEPGGGLTHPPGPESGTGATHGPSGGAPVPLSGPRVPRGGVESRGARWCPQAMDPPRRVRLKPWLVAQVSSRRFPGLRWLDPERRRFVIPWGHATRNPPGPQDHDTIFKAWAQETGRFRAGDPPDPPRWKATLRCALNKSREFRLLLDGPRGSPAQPFRVYELCEEPRGGAEVGDEDDYGCSGEEDVSQLQKMTSLSIDVTDLELKFQYRGRQVCALTVSNPHGCRLFHSSLEPTREQEELFGPLTLEQVPFPAPDAIPNEKQRFYTHQLLDVLDRGLILELQGQDLFALRLCQCKVFWTGPCASPQPGPNPIQRERRTKLFSLEGFLNGLIQFQKGQTPTPPPFEIFLCFGEEWPDQKPKEKKLITVQVVPVAARLLLEMFSGELSWSADSIPLQISHPDLKDRMVEQFKELHQLWQSHQRLPPAQPPPGPSTGAWALPPGPLPH
ncbi:interferon regulatory factor 5 isoform X3 [Aphelocoma coerulescens]|uniref:interferon regulatory factor 5 isoform X3 n=1 Tax=Aphelocoma coerulescens TaxID=39617 RepID=UPI0036043B62